MSPINDRGTSADELVFINIFVSLISNWRTLENVHKSGDKSAQTSGTPLSLSGSAFPADVAAYEEIKIDVVSLIIEAGGQILLRLVPEPALALAGAIMTGAGFFRIEAVR